MGKRRGRRGKQLIQSAGKVERQRKVAHFIRKGVTNRYTLGKKFDVNPTTIHKDIIEITTRWRERAEKEDENLVVVRKEELRDFINMCRKEHKVSKKQIYECKKCDGAGYLDDNMLKPCPKCEGEGEIIKYDGPANPAWIKEGRTCLIEITRLEGFQNNLKVQHNHSGTVGVVKIDADNLLANADEETIIETKLLLEQLEIDQRKAKEKIIDVEPIEKEETDDGRAE